MPDYQFYTQIYQGTSIPEGAFRGLIRRAEDWLSGIEGCCRVESPGPDSRKMALCAIAEAIRYWGRRDGVLETSVGGVSVRYDRGDCLQRRLLESACVYLDIYRGAGL